MPAFHKNVFRNIFSLLFIFLLSSFNTTDNPGLNIVFIGDSITYGTGILTHVDDSPPPQTHGILSQTFGFKDVNISNQGISGYTTLNFLPGTPGFENVKKAATELQENHANNILLFSIMLGTNDSAEEGPLGAPVSPENFGSNLETIIDSLSKKFPKARFIIHRPIWYSPNAFNSTRYLQEGLHRLQSYDPIIRSIVKEYSKKRAAWVYEGDKNGFIYFREHFRTDLQFEDGRKGKYCLHPNELGAAALGKFWAEAIDKAINKK